MQIYIISTNNILLENRYRPLNLPSSLQYRTTWNTKMQCTFNSVEINISSNQVLLIHQELLMMITFEQKLHRQWNLAKGLDKKSHSTQNPASYSGFSSFMENMGITMAMADMDLLLTNETWDRTLGATAVLKNKLSAILLTSALLRHLPALTTTFSRRVATEPYRGVVDEDVKSTTYILT